MYGLADPVAEVVPVVEVIAKLLPDAAMYPDAPKPDAQADSG